MASKTNRVDLQIKTPNAAGIFTTVVAVSLLMISGAALAAEFNIEMKNKAFSVKSLQIKPGDTVSFKNGDTFSHNIFSLSEAKAFDLGSFSHYQSRSVTFDEAGTVHVECAMHAEEKMTITIRR